MMRTIFSVISLVAAGAIFMLYTKPTYDGVQSQNAQIAQYDQALEKATELQQLKQTLLSRYNTFNPSDIDRLQKLLPDHVDNVRLILDLDSLAGKHGMALQNVAVSSAESNSNTTQTASGAIGASKQKYDSLTIKFTTQGTYDTFKSFIADLEKDLRVVDLVSLSLSNASGSGQNALYTYDITLRTYWLK
jgi:Tfp pilus assembly protein PilO